MVGIATAKAVRSTPAFASAAVTDGAAATDAAHTTSDTPGVM
jgi:hypothetical protein